MDFQILALSFGLSFTSYVVIASISWLHRAILTTVTT